MKILNFDNTRVSNFINQNLAEIEPMFWQEFIWLAAYFWCQAFTGAVKHETEKNRNKYLGNPVESMKLAIDKRHEVDGLYDAMIGMMPQYLKKD